MKIKVEDIRKNRKINYPIIFVPQGSKKNHVIILNGQILVDDSKKNINGLIDNGGVGYIFNSSLQCNTKEKVRSL